MEIAIPTTVSWSPFPWLREFSVVDLPGFYSMDGIDLDKSDTLFFLMRDLDIKGCWQTFDQLNPAVTAFLYCFRNLESLSPANWEAGVFRRRTNFLLFPSLWQNGNPPTRTSRDHHHHAHRTQLVWSFRRGPFRLRLPPGVASSAQSTRQCWVVLGPNRRYLAGGAEACFLGHGCTGCWKKWISLRRYVSRQRSHRGLGLTMLRVVDSSTYCETNPRAHLASTQQREREYDVYSRLE